MSESSRPQSLIHLQTLYKNHYFVQLLFIQPFSGVSPRSGLQKANLKTFEGDFYGPVAQPTSLKYMY